MKDGLHRFVVGDRTYGDLRLAVVLPSEDDPWGVLAPLRGTSWEGLVQTVPGEAVAHARHGYAAPLVRVLGPGPNDLARKVSVEHGRCRLAALDVCASASPTCRPGPRGPPCYEPPGLSPDAQEAASLLVGAWRDGYHVVVVIGEEFRLV